MTATNPLNSSTGNSPVSPSSRSTVISDHEPVSGIIVVNLQKYGYQQAGRNQGDPRSLKNLLEMILNGRLVAEDNNEARRERARKELEERIQVEKVALNQLLSEIRSIEEAEIPSLQRRIGEKEAEIRAMEQQERESRHAHRPDRFNLRFYWIILGLATLFLWGFYTSTFYSAFYRDIAAELSKATSGSLSTIMNVVFSSAAFDRFGFYWLAPTVFFVFAAVLHIAWESKKHRWIWVPLVAVAVFIGDALMAYFVEANNHKLQVLMGMDNGQWVYWKSPVFYIVLVLGFLTAMAWSIVLYKIRSEMSGMPAGSGNKKEYGRMMGQIESLKAMIEEWRKKAIALEARVENVRMKIEELDKEKGLIRFSVADMRQSLNQLYAGWQEFMNGPVDDFVLLRREECEITFREFLEDHFHYRTKQPISESVIDNHSMSLPARLRASLGSTLNTNL